MSLPFGDINAVLGEESSQWWTVTVEKSQSLRDEFKQLRLKFHCSRCQLLLASSGSFSLKSNQHFQVFKNEKKNFLKIYLRLLRGKMRRWE